MPHFSDDIRLGPVVLPADMVGSGNPSPMEKGVGPMGRIYVWDLVPAANAANNIVVNAAPAAAGSLVLTAGAGTTLRVGADQLSSQIVLDVPRAVTIGGTGGAPFTIYGIDQYGQPMSELLAVAGTGKKAFKVITRITNGASGSAINAGTSSIIGVPFKISDPSYIVSANFGGAAVPLSNYVPADSNPATTTTGDVRGTLGGSTLDGTKRLVVVVAVPAIQCGPNATRLAVAGVTQA